MWDLREDEKFCIFLCKTKTLELFLFLQLQDCQTWNSWCSVSKTFVTCCVTSYYITNIPCVAYFYCCQNCMDLNYKPQFALLLALVFCLFNWDNLLIHITCRTPTWRDEIWRVYICTCTLTWASCSLTGFTSFSSRFVLSNLTPQLISKPTPPITKLKSILLKLTSTRLQHHWISTLVRVPVLQPEGSRFKSSPKCHFINWNLVYGKVLKELL